MRLFRVEARGNDQKIRAERKSALLIRKLRLESDKRSEGRAQIVMCASGEVDFIAGFKAQTDRADMSFQTGARIKHSTHIVRTQVFNGADHVCAVDSPGIQPEIYKTAFEREKRTNRTVAGHDLGAKESMQNA